MTDTYEFLRANARSSNMHFQSMFVAKFVGIVLVVAGWDLMVFPIVKDTLGLWSPRGASLLWVTAMAGITACIGAAYFCTFSVVTKRIGGQKL